MDTNYTVIKKKIKNAYIQIKDGQVLVKVPYKMPEKEIQRLINNKRQWIEKHMHGCNQEKTGVTILGKCYKIIEIESSKDEVQFNNDKVLMYISNNSKEKKRELLEKFYKQQAQKQYIITTQKMMKITGLKPDLWRIRNIKSAWGSCSNKKIITLSLNLIQKREEVIEYVVLHELCHLKHMNHSKDFWNLVASYMPEYKVYRKELKS